MGRFQPRLTLRAGLAIAGLVPLLLGACTTNPQSLEANDPFEPANRAILGFNVAADRAVVGPAAGVYRGVVPATGRRGISNFLTNLNQPVVFANLLLQGRPGPAFSTASRFALNTTVGVGGLFDVATEANIAEHDTDFGLTLGTWGVESGPYIVLPFLGPSSVRDASGRFVDRYPHPTWWLTGVRDGDAIWLVRAKTVLDLRVELDEAFSALRESEGDPYAQLRTFYQQDRARRLESGTLIPPGTSRTLRLEGQP